MKYLAGAYRAANGDYDRAVHYFAAGYYYVARRQRLERAGQPAPVLAAAPPKEPTKDADATPAFSVRFPVKGAAGATRALTPCRIGLH